ncbi:MAG: hypothetical protein AAGG80_00410 [Pseudomonadota bacterium]
MENQHNAIKSLIKYSLKKQFGASLVELSVAAALSVFLLLILVSVFINLKVGWKYNLSLLNIQKKAQISLQLLKKNIQTASYWGCINQIDKGNSLINNQFAFKGLTPNQAKRFLSAANLPLLSTDSFIVESADVTYARLLQPAGETDTLVVSKNLDLQPNQWILISDCQQNEIARIESIQRYAASYTILLNHRLNATYPKLSEIHPVHAYLFYVGATQRKDSNGDYIKALYQKNLLKPNNPTELEQGIDTLNLSYGIKSNGGIEYKSVQQIHNWQKVVSVLIRITLTSDSSLSKAYPDKIKKPIKKEWDGYVVLQNRIQTT